MHRYAVYGGSFDPIHDGHLSMVERAVELAYEVILVPAYRHAFGKQSSPFAHRIRMCELALQEKQFQAQARVCQIEYRLDPGDGSPVYTYDVLCQLRDHLQTVPCLLVGPDIAHEWERWYRHEAIDQEFGRLSLPMTRAIRSTDIRQRLQEGMSPDALHDLMPASVRAYIRDHGLYQ